MKLTVQTRRILKTHVNATSYDDACDRIQRWASLRRSCYVVAANVHVVTTAYRNPRYQHVLDQAALVTPDGMPLVMGLRLLGMPEQERVYGPDLMLAWCDRAARLGLPIYLYGGTAAMLETMADYLQQPLSSAEARADADRINRSGARVVFVGLGCPKQEQWMYQNQGQVQAVMIGVGAAFSFFSGEVSQAPRWMMRFGMEWLYRFSQEPRRLWQRYLVNNPLFVLLFGAQLLWHYLGGRPEHRPVNKPIP